MAISYEIRSISFPITSHPTAHKIEKEINDIKTRVMSSLCKPSSTESLCDGLLKLSRLYECMHEFIDSLSSTHNQKWVEELMEDLVEFLDACGLIRDLISQIKEHIRDLQCAFRRRKGDPSIETSISRYNCFTKKVKKDVKRLMTSFKRSLVANSKDSDRHHDRLEVVVQMVVTEVREVTVSFFQSLLIALFIVPDSRTLKGNIWSFGMSKLSQKTRVSCEEHHYQQQEQDSRGMKDFEGLDVNVLLQEGFIERLSSWSYAKCKLEKMEVEIERMEGGLESVFRRLIRTRTSLLNIVSHY